MKFRVSDSVFGLFPDLVVGVVVAREVVNAGTNDGVAAALRDAENEIAQKLGGVAVTEHPNISVWRDAYRRFGAKPKDYSSSVENLVRRASKNHHLPHINLLVDLYNTISLRYLVPVGGEDMDSIVGDVRLTRASADEPPVRLLGENEERPPRAGEVIYRDDVGAICRRFNWKEAERTKLTESTRNAILVMEGLPPVGEGLARAVEDLARDVQRYCGGETMTAIVTAKRPELRLAP